VEITVKGFNKKVSAELREAAEFFADILMDPRMVRNLMIDIERDKKSDVQGECIDEDGTRNPRWFTINLRGAADDDDLVKTLAHEMVHVKQHAKNELRSGVMVATKGGLAMRSKWMGKIWKPRRKEDAYFDAPWEIEAYGKEVGLYQKWVLHTNQQQ
jgi:hypothetical protein